MTTTDMAGQAGFTIDGQSPNLGDLSAHQKRELLAKLLRQKARRAKQFPMSVGQQGLWYAFRRDPQDTSFNVFLPTRIRSAIDLDALQRSVNFVAGRHASLRTTFSDAAGQLLQTVDDELMPDFRVQEAQGSSDRDMQRRIREEAQQPFDLSRGPLSRILVYRLAEDDWIVVAITHHIIIDFWSLVMVMDEMREAYSHFSNGWSLRLQPAVDNYREFVAEQEALLGGEAGKRLREYWTTATQDISPVIELPTDFSRPNRFTGRAGSYPLNLPSDLLPRIQALASEQKATTFSVIQSALQVFISRYASQKSFFMGTPFSGRSHQRYERTVGFFINMLPLAARLEPDPSFAELVQTGTQRLLEALEHEAYPVAHIVNDAQVPRDPSRSPMFQVSCTFEKSHLAEEKGRAAFLFPGEKSVWNFGGLKQESFYVPHPTSHYDLEFIFEQADTRLKGMICYCRDLFSERSIAAMASNFVGLLRQLLENERSPISRVAWHSQPSSALASPADHGERPFSQQFSPSTAGLKVHDLLTRSMSAYGQEIAIRFNGRSVTYQDLQAACQDYERQLQQADVEQGGAVPVVAKRGPEVISAIQAIHRSGCAFVPIDGHHSSLQLEQVLADTRASQLLAIDQSLAEDQLRVPIVHLQTEAFKKSLRADNVWSNFSSEESTRMAIAPPNDYPMHEDAPRVPERGLSTSLGQPTAGESSDWPEDLAYVVYTSGSTGRPKGVLVQHAAVCNTLNWRREHVPLGVNDKVLLLLSHQFDAGLGVAWTTLTQGASLIWATDAETRDPDRLMDLLIREKATILPAPPSILAILISHPRFPECAQLLRQIWTGGEAMPPELPDRLRTLTKASFLNFYGPTEASIEATFFDATLHPPNRPVPLGRAISNTEILVLDEYHREVPDTVPGELAIGGRGLAVGYLGQPQLTLERFVPHPRYPDQRIYLTGDRGRRNAEGEIEFLGRLDSQVKLRGYRIELGEIESLLESHYLVDRAAAKVLEGGTSQARLIAYYSLSVQAKEARARQAEQAAGSRQITEAIRRFAVEQLANFKVPSVLIPLETMPLTSSGKVDRSRLPTEITPELLLREIVEPDTALEAFLAERWCQYLSVPKVSIRQDFFDAGGSSLQAAALTTQLSNELAVAVPTALLFDLADICQLANRLVELYPQAIEDRFGADCVKLQRQKSIELAKLASVEHPLIAPLKPSGGRTPIFMVHPPGGIVVCYRELAAALDAEQPFFGIRSRGLHSEEPLPNSLESMASDYLQALRSIQPHGPYIIGGWSLGGLVAYEMAQQLLAQDEVVERLLLLDTTIHTGATELVPENELVSLGSEYGIEMSLQQMSELPPEDQLPFLWDHAQKLGVLEADAPAEVVERVLQDLQGLFHHHLSLSQAYRIEPTTVPIALFRPQDAPVELDVKPDRGWSFLTSQVEVHLVPGHHHSMVQTPHVEQLALKLQSSIPSN